MFVIKHRDKSIFPLILKIYFGVNLTHYFERREVALP